MDARSAPDARPVRVPTPDLAPLAELVAVMDRLRSPGGCPWDAEQTHATLLPHAIEEVHEVVEAVETGDRDGLREELGDLLLQVVFHARIAQEHSDRPFDLDDVARTVTEKLVRRHPHVFGDVQVSGAEQVHANWDRIKRAEKRRESALDGIPPTLPALARAQKVLTRIRRSGLAVEPEPGPEVGDRLLALVAEAERDGLDAEQELRAAVRRLESAARAAERSGSH